MSALWEVIAMEVFYQLGPAGAGMSRQYFCESWNRAKDPAYRESAEFQVRKLAYYVLTGKRL